MRTTLPKSSAARSGDASRSSTAIQMKRVAIAGFLLGRDYVAAPLKVQAPLNVARDGQTVL
jgi:hypothetical protein